METCIMKEYKVINYHRVGKEAADLTDTTDTHVGGTGAGINKERARIHYVALFVF